MKTSSAQYKSDFDGLADEEIEEESFVRGYVFKTVIPKIYDDTCCISGLRVIALMSISMVDACHIVPFSISYDDTVSNGIALCPNLHRAFDRGMTAIDDNYHVLISSQFSENDNHYGITQFAGRQILLPDDPSFRPAMENLAWHRKTVFNP